MSFIEKRGARYRARFTDPNGTQHSRTFARTPDATQFLRDVDADLLRGRWVDPRDAYPSLESWSAEFLQLARRLAAAHPGDLPAGPGRIRPAAPRIGSGIHRPTRSRTGSTTRSMPGSARPAAGLAGQRT